MIESIGDLLQRIPEYLQTIKRRTAAAQTERQVRDAEEAVGLDQIQAFQTSTLAAEARQLLGPAMTNHIYSSSKFILVLDATVAQFRMAKKIADGKYIVVSKHKTTQHQGPVQLIYDSKMLAQLKQYVEKVRPQVVDSSKDDGALFVTEAGVQFERGTIGRRVTATFDRLGLRTPNRPICCAPLGSERQ